MGDWQVVCRRKKRSGRSHDTPKVGQETSQGRMIQERYDTYVRAHTPELIINHKQILYDQADVITFHGVGPISQWDGFWPSKYGVLRAEIRKFQVFRPGLSMQELQNAMEPPHAEELKEEFKSLNEEEITEHKLRELAQKYNYQAGHWIMMNVPWTKANSIWQKAVTKLMDGKLNHVFGIKIGTKDRRIQNIFSDQNAYTQIVFVIENYQDNHQVDEVLDEIRQFGFQYDIIFKPAIYTYLEIFARNKYDIRPTLKKSYGSVRHYFF